MLHQPIHFFCNFATNKVAMKKRLMICLLVICCAFITTAVQAQCSICTKTAQQLGEGPAKGLNTGILYLAFAPFLIVGYIGYRWWKSNKA
jgi:hypothetical protein